MAEEINGVIDSRVKELISVKKEIAKEITAKGVSTLPTDPFNTFAAKIAQIPMGDSSDYAEEMTITKNGTYRAPDGKAGVKKVIVNVPTGGGGGSGGGGGEEPSPGITFTCKFFDSDDRSKAQQFGDDVIVPKGEPAPLPADAPKKEGHRFKQWEPSVLNVQADTNFYPVFVQVGLEIEDDWDTICENSGSEYGVGDYKTLPVVEYGIPYIISGGPLNNRTDATSYVYNFEKSKVNIVMEKVAEGEGGTTSTWICKVPVSEAKLPMHTFDDDAVLSHLKKYLNNGLTPPSLTVPIGEGVTWDDISRYYSDISSNIDLQSRFWSKWENSFARRYLNEIIFPSVHTAVVEHVSSVTKNSCGYDGSGLLVSDIQTTDKFWLLSASECKGYLNNYETEWTSYYRTSKLEGNGGYILLRSNYRDTSGIPANAANAIIPGTGGSSVFANTIQYGDNYNNYSIVFGFCL